MLAKNITEIKLFIKELDGKNRSNRKTYILVRNCREGSLFCDVHLITITQNKEHLFLSYCQSQEYIQKYNQEVNSPPLTPQYITVDSPKLPLNDKDIGEFRENVRKI